MNPNHEKTFSETMATAQKIKPLRLLNLVVGVPQEVQQPLPTKFKEIQSQEHPLLLETLLQMRDNEMVVFNLDSIFSCVLAFLLLDRLHSHYSKELQDEVEAILSRVLEKEPENLISLCIKQEFRKTKATKEKIKTLVDCPDSLNHAYAVTAFYLYKLDPRNITASMRLFEQAVKVWEDNGKGNEVKVIVWKQLLAEVYCQVYMSQSNMLDKDFNPPKIIFQSHELMNLLQSGAALKTEQDIPLRYLAARCYAVLAWHFNEIGLGKIVDEPISKLYFDQASGLCDRKDPYVMEKYGIFMRKTARTRESLDDAAEIFECILADHPQRHVAEFELGLTYKALWTIDKNFLQRHIFLNNFDDWVNEYIVLHNGSVEICNAFLKCEVSNEATSDDIECSAGDPPLKVSNGDCSKEYTLTERKVDDILTEACNAWNKIFLELSNKTTEDDMECFSRRSSCKCTKW